MLDAKDDLNPVGPLIATSFGAAEAFKVIVKKAYGTAFSPVNELSASALDYRISEEDLELEGVAIPSEVKLGSIVQVSCGGVGMAFDYALASLANPKGELLLLDPEMLEVSNMNRYLLATVKDADRPRVNIVRDVHILRFPSLLF